MVATLLAFFFASIPCSFKSKCNRSRPSFIWCFVRNVFSSLCSLCVPIPGTSRRIRLTSALAARLQDSISLKTRSLCSPVSRIPGLTHPARTGGPETVDKSTPYPPAGSDELVYRPLGRSAGAARLFYDRDVKLPGGPVLFGDLDHGLVGLGL